MPKLSSPSTAAALASQTAAAIQSMARNFSGAPSHPQSSHPPPHTIPLLRDVIRSEESFLHRPLTPYELHEVQDRVEYMKNHFGHESEHLEMMLIFITTLVAAQLLIVLWKKYHARSYHTATLLGLWLIPFAIAVRANHTRFKVIWIIFSLINAYIVKIALETPMKSMTPRLVYNWVCYH